jgi:glycosyltransferase involved in cell wall biosynthesis
MVGQVRVAVIDPNCGLAVGHHQKWFGLFHEALPDGAQVEIVHSEYALQDAADRRHWYSHALETPAALWATDWVFLSGDDALLGVMRSSRALRKRRVRLHFVIFRVDPQPGLRGLIAWTVRMISREFVLAVMPKRAFFYPVLTPTRKNLPRTSRRAIAMVDSSHLEAREPVGRDTSRARIGLSNTSERLFLVIGMLGPGKHVDTIVRAWLSRPPDGGVLLLVGETESMTAEWLRDSLGASGSSIRWVNRRVSDEEFDDYIEAADFVFALYRYSASSGVVLRSLALGTPVLYGGSKTLLRDLRAIDGAIPIQPVSVARIVASMENLPQKPFTVGYPSAAAELAFPAPIINNLMRSGRMGRDA